MLVRESIDEVRPAGAHPDPAYPGAQELLEPPHVSLAVLRQLLEAAAARDVLLPAGQSLVCHRNLSVLLQRCRHADNLLTLGSVLRADFDLFEAAQNVQLGKVDFRRSVQHECVLQLRDVDPPAPARSTSGGSATAQHSAELLTKEGMRRDAK